MPLCVVLYWRLRPSLDTAITLVLGRLFLPERIGLSLPIVPDLTKETITVLAAWLGCLFTARHQLARSKPLRGIDLWVLLILIGDIGAAMTNADADLARSPRSGLTSHDMVAQICEDIILVGGSFLIGRAMFRFLPHPPDQRMMVTGVRPVVFLDHALTLARFMLCAVLAGVLLLRTRSLHRMWIAPFAYLLIVFVLLKSEGAGAIALLMLPLCAFASARSQLRVASLLAVIVGLYPLLRAAELFPEKQLLSWVETISRDRVDSMQVRFANENDLLRKTRERLLFGWGTHDRQHLYDTDGDQMSIIESEWIGTLGKRGLIGYVSCYAL